MWTIFQMSNFLLLFRSNIFYDLEQKWHTYAYRNRRVNGFKMHILENKYSTQIKTYHCTFTRRKIPQHTAQCPERSKHSKNAGWVSLNFEVVQTPSSEPKIGTYTTIRKVFVKVLQLLEDVSTSKLVTTNEGRGMAPRVVSLFLRNYISVWEEFYL